MIDSFSGEYRFLSNFYYAPFFYEHEEYSTVEHAYQAYKCAYAEDREEIIKAMSPGLAKRLGQKVKLRADWEQIKVEVMTCLVREKFAQNPELKSRLLATYTEELVEGNNWGDRFWGVCRGQGENHLGKILMKLRNEFCR